MRDEILKEIGVQTERIEINFTGAFHHGHGQVTVIVVLGFKIDLRGYMDDLLGIIIDRKAGDSIKLQRCFTKAVSVEELIPRSLLALCCYHIQFERLIGTPLGNGKGGLCYVVHS